MTAFSSPPPGRTRRCWPNRPPRPTRCRAGRLTLGLAPGGCRDGFEASGAGFSRRGRIFERQPDEMTAVWRGERGIGPPPGRDGRTGLLIGGRAEAGCQRAARYGDGWTMGGGPAAMVTQAPGKLTAASSAAGRAGRPRTMALFYFALGGDAEKMASDSLGDGRRRPPRHAPSSISAAPISAGGLAASPVIRRACGPARPYGWCGPSGRRGRTGPGPGHRVPRCHRH